MTKCYQLFTFIFFFPAKNERKKKTLKNIIIISHLWRALNTKFNSQDTDVLRHKSFKLYKEIIGFDQNCRELVNEKGKSALYVEC